jgi:hypothetical protein
MASNAFLICGEASRGRDLMMNVLREPVERTLAGGMSFTMPVRGCRRDGRVDVEIGGVLAEKLMWRAWCQIIDGCLRCLRTAALAKPHQSTAHDGSSKDPRAKPHLLSRRYNNLVCFELKTMLIAVVQ